MDATALAQKLIREPALGMDDAVPVRAAPDAGTVGRFNDYMATPPGGGVEPAAAVEASAAAGRSTPGDSILQGLSSMASDMGRSWKAAQDALNSTNGQPTMQDMMRMQIELVGMSMNYELVNKCVTRSTQNIDQLVKLQ